MSGKRQLYEEATMMQAHPIRNNTDEILWCSQSDFFIKSLLVKVGSLNKVETIVE